MRRCASARGAGVTLIELLFAASITAVTLLGVAGMFPTAFRSVVEGGKQTKATALAQLMIEAIRSEPFNLLVDRYDAFDTRQGLPGYTCPVSGASTDPNYTKMRLKCEMTWTAAQESGQGLPDGYAIVVVACLNADGSVNVGRPCATDLREVRITVFWERQGAKTASLLTHVARAE
ncbi:MAG TPA: hypothetical protein VMG58_01210 [Candidatus Sulfotelmatobacter sp.]|nr:hypothetical protein [Candidatus Sulfotelmatobacter sp.]